MPTPLPTCRAAICTVESDRITVEDNVVCLMLYLKYVPSHCTRDDALNAFDLMVRREMPRKIRASTGRFLLRHEYVTPMALPMLLCTFDVACAHLVTGASVRELVSSSIEMLARSLTALPLCLAVNMWLSGLFHKLRGLKETLYNLFAGMANFFTGTVLYFLLRLLQTNAVDDDMLVLGWPRRAHVSRLPQAAWESVPPAHRESCNRRGARRHKSSRGIIPLETCVWLVSGVPVRGRGQCSLCFVSQWLATRTRGMSVIPLELI